MEWKRKFEKRMGERKFKGHFARNDDYKFKIKPRGGFISSKRYLLSIKDWRGNHILTLNFNKCGKAKDWVEKFTNSYETGGAKIKPIMIGDIY